jgi:G3E family GTPase
MKNRLPVDIINGFLGAGKTTFIRKLLREAYVGERVALLENEYGQEAIDGAVIADTGVTVRELSGGCICCSLKGSLVAGLMELAGMPGVDRIVIEPTGLALPQDIVAACLEAGSRAPLAKPTIITVVDAERFSRMKPPAVNFLQAQIESADAVVLSCVSQAGKEKTDRARTRIYGQCPQTPVYSAEWERLSALEVLNEAERRRDSRQEECAGRRHERGAGHSHECHEGHGPCGHGEHQHIGHDNPDVPYDAFSAKTDKEFTGPTLDRLKELLSATRAGEVVRAKAILLTETGMARVDYVPGRFQIEAYDGGSGAGKAVVIGTGRDGGCWRDFFEAREVSLISGSA